MSPTFHLSGEDLNFLLVLNFWHLMEESTNELQPLPWKEQELVNRVYQSKPLHEDMVN